MDVSEGLLVVVVRFIHPFIWKQVDKEQKELMSNVIHKNFCWKSPCHVHFDKNMSSPERSKFWVASPYNKWRHLNVDVEFLRVVKNSSWLAKGYKNQ